MRRNIIKIKFEIIFNGTMLFILEPKKESKSTIKDYYFFYNYRNTYIFSSKIYYFALKTFSIL